MNLDSLEQVPAQALAALRVVTALTFTAHGTQKMFGFPASQMRRRRLRAVLADGRSPAVLEVFGGLAILLGLFTRPVAFILAGEMAYAFWFVHVPMMGQGNIIPVANGGDGAVLFCFVFLYLVFAGPGAWSARRDARSAPQAPPQPDPSKKAASRGGLRRLRSSGLRGQAAWAAPLAVRRAPAAGEG